MITERWFQLQSGGAVVFVVDASDAGAPALSQAFELLRRMVRLLPVAADHQLMFLGSDQTYSLSDLEKKWSVWVRDNAGRLSVIHSVYESLTDSGDTIVVLAASRIFDLPDWQDTPQIYRTVFVRLGDTSLGDGITLDAPDPEALKRSVQRSPTRVEIGGEGLIPTYWDNPEFAAQPTLRLEAGRNGEHTDYQAVLAFAGRPSNPVFATATYAGGRTEDLSLVEVGVPVPYRDWIALPPNEARVVRDCITRKEYTCPHCEGPHPADVLICPQPGPNGPASVLTSIDDQTAGFVVLRQRDDQVEYRPHGSAAFRLSYESVALRCPALTLVYRFDNARGMWAPEPGEFHQFHALPGGDHVIFI